MSELSNEYREQALQHFSRAVELLESGDAKLDRYACLEARLCIEAIAYGVLHLYRSELTQSSISKWQPPKVLKELLAVDPNATTGHTLSIQDEKTKEWLVVGGTDHRFSAKWANEAYNALGNALHVPTIAQLKKGKQARSDDFRSRYEKYMPELRRVIESKSWHLYFTGPNWKVKCQCGFEMKRRVEAVQASKVLVCSDCGRMYNVTETGSDEITIELRRIVWNCRSCNTGNAMPEHELAERIMTKCRQCGEPTQVRRVWAMFQRDTETGAAA